jgi:hypothetical protein
VPLPVSQEREELHQRQIIMKAYKRQDGLFDIEARMMDTKSAPFSAPLSKQPLSPGQPIHDLWIRLVVDESLFIHEALAVSDSTPFPVCKEASVTLSVLKGERIGTGWNKIVREKLKGAASCTHLMELLTPMATTAMQAMWPIKQKSPVRLDATGRPVKIDSCYAYAANRTVIQQLYPEHYTGSKD